MVHKDFNRNLLVSFSGAQSTGKTTLLKAIQQAHPSGAIYVPEVTRRLKRDYGIMINEAGGDVTQLLICADHLQNVVKYKADEAPIMPTILDRCSLDGVVYTFWMYAMGLVSQDTLSAAVSTYDHTISDYATIFYTDPLDVKLEDDGERSIDVSFRLRIIEIFNWIISGAPAPTEWAGSDMFNKPLPSISKPSCPIVKLSGTVEERLETFYNTLNKL